MSLDPSAPTESFKDLPGHDGAGNAFSWSFGQRFGQRFHAFLLIGSYIAVTIFALVGLLPLFSLAVWLTFPLAWSNVRSVLSATERRAFIIGIKRTASLHLQFGVVLSLAIVVAAFIRV